MAEFPFPSGSQPVSHQILTCRGRLTDGLRHRRDSCLEATATNPLRSTLTACLIDRKPTARKAARSSANRETDRKHKERT